MKISPKLAEEIFAKHNNFDHNKYDKSNAKAAIFTFSGDVYKGLEADTLNSKTIEYSQSHLLMLSPIWIDSPS